MRWLVRNWHLKFAAVAVATILYTGFVYSGTFTEKTFSGAVIRATGQPSGTFLTPQQLGTVDIQYRSTTTVDATQQTFDVTVDLGGYDMDHSGEPQAVRIGVTSLSDDVTVLSYSPSTVSVTIDPRVRKEVPVRVEMGTPPDGLIVAEPRLSAKTVTAIGPASVLDQVDHARAAVRIDQSGVSVSTPVQLEAVDVRGAVIGPNQGVTLTPDSVTVQIDVTPAETTKVVPVVASVAGTPGVGFVLGEVRVDSPVVTLEGLSGALGAVTEVVTGSVSIAGLTADATFTPDLVIPAGARLAGGQEATVTVSVTVTATDATRTLLVGAQCVNVAAGAACLPQTDQLAVTISGPGATLADLSAADLTVILDVGGIASGTRQITPAVPALPAGVTLLSISPGTVTVVVQPPSTPTPAPTATPAPSG